MPHYFFVNIKKINKGLITYSCILQICLRAYLYFIRFSIHQCILYSLAFKKYKIGYIHNNFNLVECFRCLTWIVIYKYFSYDQLCMIQKFVNVCYPGIWQLWVFYYKSRPDHGSYSCWLLEDDFRTKHQYPSHVVWCKSIKFYVSITFIILLKLELDCQVLFHTLLHT